MTLSLLEIIQTAYTELGLNAPTTVIGNSDLQVKQGLSLANREGQSLYRDHPWTVLQNEFIVNVASPIVTVGDVANNSALIINIPNTAGLDDNYAVSGLGMPQAQRIVEVIDANTVRCEMLSTATVVGTPITFAKDTYELPSSFDRYIDQTWWDRTNHWRLIGPDSPQMSQYIRSGIFSTGPRIRWNQIGAGTAKWRIWPPPTAQNTPDALVFMYIAKDWVQHQDGTFGDSFIADIDIPILDPQAFILGVKWRLWQIKRFEYADMQQEYLDYIDQLRARDGGIPDLYLNRRAGPYLISSDNIQDGYFPGPGNP